MNQQGSSNTTAIDGIMKAIPGVLLFVSVAVFAWYITPKITALHPAIKALSISNFIVAILLGMLILNTVGVPEIFKAGLKFSTILTKTGIVVMGVKYSFESLIKTGSEALIIIAIFLFSSAIILMLLSRKLNMPPALGACLAAGLSVCGVSAAIAIAPAVRAKNEDMAYTIAVVLMFGLLALIVFPYIGTYFGLSANQFGAFAGVGIINSAQVLAAGAAFTDATGVNAAHIAGVYNIGRVMFLPIVVLMLAMMVATQDEEVKDHMAGVNKMQMIIDKFPVFVFGFIAVVLLNTFEFFTKPEVKQATVFMDWCFLLGFASIGLTTRLADIKAAGLSGLVLGFVVATIKAALALFVVLTFLN
ncbi:conserved hypothetical integral membrane protein [Desulfovibrio litoralis DSM 11393]|uniref:Conserved hypothetical integral membrane protein n=2 Tax=Desulfovibrio litoralis TaxID=466107 RepID=A0A1M7RWC3_9BACT|nr:putative sulfate exporter family transporter [Desulfovibrio litoralis]SHN50575.1 conserved hypothetical integral membrane protein [Desulfovibrio litoralis DSM 11393]